MLRHFERLQAVLLARRDCCSGLTFAQCHPLLEIGEVGRATIGGLAARLGLDKSTLSRTVDNLVKVGLVRRRANRRDRRFMVVTLTVEGQRLCDEINMKNDEFYSAVLERIPHQKRGDFLRLFQRFLESLEGTSEKGPKSNSDAAQPCERCASGIGASSPEDNGNAEPGVVGAKRSRTRGRRSSRI